MNELIQHRLNPEYAALDHETPTMQFVGSDGVPVGFVYNHQEVPYPIHANAGIAPPRFRNQEDAELFMECLRTKRKFPEEKWIHPYKVVGSLCIVSPEYTDAPFELVYLYKPSTRIVND